MFPTPMTTSPSPMLLFRIGSGPILYASMDNSWASYLAVDGAAESPSSITTFNRDLSPLHAVPIIISFQQYLLNHETPALPKDSLNNDTRNSIPGLIIEYVFTNTLTSTSIHDFWRN